MNTTMPAGWVTRCGCGMGLLAGAVYGIAAADGEAPRAAAQEQTVTARRLPDLARGQRAAAAGQMQAAEADLRPLAEQGYLEAQIALARLYAHSGSAQRVADAIAWLRVARVSAPDATAVPLARLLQRQDDPAALDEAEQLLDDAYARRQDLEALAGLIRLYAQYPRRDRQQRVQSLVVRAEKIGTRRAPPDLLAAVISWYRATPQIAGHPQQVLALCHRDLDQVPECYVDLLREARAQKKDKDMQALAQAAERHFRAQELQAQTLASAARVLVAPPDEADDDAAGLLAALPVQVSDLPEDENASAQNPQPRSCDGAPLLIDPAAQAQAQAASASAQVPPANELANPLLKALVASDEEGQALAAAVAVRYPDLLADVDLEALLKRLPTKTNPQVLLTLGELYLQGTRVTRDPQQSLQYLQRALEQPEIAVQAHYFLGRLYQYGYLDESQPLQATRHLLWAARHGYAPADGALANLFARGKGLCPDWVNAYVFARLAASSSATSAQLSAQLGPRLSGEQRHLAEQRLQAEWQLRSDEAIAVGDAATRQISRGETP